MPSPRTPRVAFVTIGQTPRDDLVPEVVRWVGAELDVVERGVLDGLTPAEIATLAPGSGEHRLVTRLRDGSQVVVGRDAIRRRAQSVLDELARDDVDLTVFLCTGHLPSLTARGLLLEAQPLVDHGVAAIAANAETVGVMLPLKEQIPECHFEPRRGQRARFSHASPYAPTRLEEAASELRDADLIVMHCIGYTDAMRRLVAESSGRPVLLARRLVAAGIAQLL